MKIRKAAVLLFALLLSGCDFGGRGTPEPTEEPESVVGITEIELELYPLGRDWYVATTGDNANSCATPEEPCLTLDRAYAKSSHSDRINIAAGTYLGADGTGELLPHLTHSIIIRGAGSTETIIDSNNNFGGRDIRGDNHLYLEGLTIRNVPRACFTTLENAGILAQDVVLQNCANGGIKHLSTGLVELADVDFIGSPGGSGISSGEGQLIISGGEISGNSEGGVFSDGELTMSGTTVTGNGHTGVFVAGTATLTDVNINGNIVSPGEWPSSRYSGLQVYGGTATVIDTNIIGNEFGVSVTSNGSLTMLGGTVSANARTGIQVDETSEATFGEVTISDNASWYAGTDLGGGIQNDGELSIIASLIENNHNGGILNRTHATLEIIDSTVRGNDGWLDGIYNSDTAVADIKRSLIADNRGDADGIENRGTMTIHNSTITGNQNSGISASDQGDLSLSFVTIARNGGGGLGAGNFGAGVSLIESVLIAENSFADCTYFSSPIGSNPLAASLRFAGTSVDSDATCRFPETFSPAELRIGTLADNGGRTWTLALDPASEAVDIVEGACLDEDQRTFIRPVGISCDAGAYETGAGTLTLEDPGFIIGTPTPEQPGNVTIITTVPCFGGPGPGYVYHSTLQQGYNLNLVGAGFTGGANDAWVVAQQPGVPNTNCWIPSQDVSTTVPFGEMQLITVPSLPTATPKPESDEPRDPNDPDAPPQDPQPPKPTCNFVAPCN